MDSKKAISLLKITPSDDGGEHNFIVEVPDEVEQWFMKSRGLTEWSDEQFNVWFKGLIREFTSDEETVKNIAQSTYESEEV